MVDAMDVRVEVDSALTQEHHNHNTRDCCVAHLKDCMKNLVLLKRRTTPPQAKQGKNIDLPRKQKIGVNRVWAQEL